MTFRSRVSFENLVPQPIPCKAAELRAALLALLVIASAGAAGTYTRTTFPFSPDLTVDSNFVTTGGALSLGIDRYQLVKLFGDSALPPNAAQSNYSDVIACKSDTFSFFWLDTAAGNIWKKDLQATANGYLPIGAPAPICSYAATQAGYLHADKGDDGYLVSFVQRGSGSLLHLKLSAFNGTKQANLDSTATGILFSSQCAFSGDTFLVVNSADWNRLTVRKVYSNGSNLQVLNSATVATGAAVPDSTLINCSVAAEPNGKILVTWTCGTPAGKKYLCYRLYDHLLNALTGIMGWTTQICNNNRYCYDDEPAVGYAPGWFAVATWDPTGIWLHKIDASTGAISDTEIIAKAGATFCALTTNSHYLVVACKGDVDGNSNAGIEGLRFAIDGSNLDNAVVVSYTNSNFVDSISDMYSSAINCALDTAGDLGVTWRHIIQTQGCVMGNRGVRDSRGFWTSPVESLAVAPADSVVFYPASVVVSPDLSSWYLEDSIRIGCSTTDFTNATPWNSLSSAAVLQAQKGNCHYFQYRIALIRKAFALHPDSLSTPSITGITIPYDVQPAVVSIDSVFVNGTDQKSIAFDSTIQIRSRSDTLRLAFACRDTDPGDTLHLRTTRPSRDSLVTLSPPSPYEASVRFYPIMHSDSVAQCSVSVSDLRGWTSVVRHFTIKTHNSPPQLQVRYRRPAGDTVALAGRIDLQQEDSVEFFYSVADSNDPSTARAVFARKDSGAQVLLDSTGTGMERHYTLHANTTPPADSVLLRFFAHDPDTTVDQYGALRVNHPPVIRSFLCNNVALAKGDSVRIVPGDSIQVTVNIADTDIVRWDTLTVRYKSRVQIDSLKSRSSTVTFSFTPTARDTLLSILVHDHYNRADSVLFYFKFPWFNIDTSVNPGYQQALDSLGNGISLIAGSDSTRKLALPFKNTGNDTMSIVSVKFTHSSSNWLSLAIPQNGDTIAYTYDNIAAFQQVTLPPNAVLTFSASFSAQKLTGDSVYHDTLIFGTSDPLHPYDTVPVQLEFNDLPRIVDIRTYFSSQPYTPLSKRAAQQTNSFPPQASFEILFSEPMDSASALKGVTVHSVFDSIADHAATPVGLDYTWSLNYTQLNLTAHYTAKSDYFNLFPPHGLFIPTDSLDLVLSPALTDRAHTPSGPNPLDIHEDFQRVAAGDTSVLFRVDSITFSLVAITPSNGDTGIPKRPTIELSFSAPLLASSIDLSKTHNRILTVGSHFNGNDTIQFDTIAVQGSTISFRPARRFFYNDSVWCVFHGSTVRNLMGFPPDNTHEGIPVTLFDTASHADDMQWSFHIKQMKLLTVSPDSGKSIQSIRPTITLTFSDTLFPGTFDFDTSAANKSFSMHSAYEGTGEISFSSIGISRDSTKITLVPERNFFSADSISCQFSGFNADYRYTNAVNLPSPASPTYSARSWHFFTANLGFYTYPNPYKPSLDSRHKANGGIWFKNLHELKAGINDVAIKIFNIRAVPLLDTRAAGIRIHFETGSSVNKPEWLWDTRNQAGEEVGSGVYFYAIYDTRGKLLFKGKLMIVR